MADVDDMVYIMNQLINATETMFIIDLLLDISKIISETGKTEPILFDSGIFRHCLEYGCFGCDCYKYRHFSCDCIDDYHKIIDPKNDIIELQQTSITLNDLNYVYKKMRDQFNKLDKLGNFLTCIYDYKGIQFDEEKKMWIIQWY
jgi:hypothetical protein